MTDEGDSSVVAVGTNVLEFHEADDDGAPDPRSLLAVEDLEVGKRYFVYVTNNSGLYRYDMNDIVEVTGLHDRTPLVRFIQKGKGVVSFTGEKLYEVQVIAAVDEALAANRGRYDFIAAVAELVDGRARRAWSFSSSSTGIAEPSMVDRLDASLCRQNSEYETKRTSLRYDPPVIRVVKSGEFDRYRRRMVESGQRADGQFKVLRLTADVSFAAEFETERELVSTGPWRPGPPAAPAANQHTGGPCRGDRHGPAVRSGPRQGDAGECITGCAASGMSGRWSVVPHTGSADARSSSTARAGRRRRSR
jgi:hypothetical protein